MSMGTNKARPERMSLFRRFGSGGMRPCRRTKALNVTRLIEPLTLRGTAFRTRVFVAPMCQYSPTEGRPTDWHLVHLGSFARGGAGLGRRRAAGAGAPARPTLAAAPRTSWAARCADQYLRRPHAEACCSKRDGAQRSGS